VDPHAAHGENTGPRHALLNVSISQREVRTIAKMQAMIEPR